MTTKYSLLFFALVLLPMINFAQSANTDESKVPKFDLPELLVSKDGKRIGNAKAWEQIRRPEILKIFEEKVFGKAPAEELAIDITEKVLNSEGLNGKATIKEVTFTFQNNGKSQEAVLLLFLPNQPSKPVPVFLGYNFSGNHTVFPDETILITRSWRRDDPNLGVQDNEASTLSRGAKFSRWPILNIINRGYGLATMYYGDIDPDFDDGFKNGVHALFDKSTNGKLQGDDWGSIATWAWALTKVMDYFETDAVIDHQKVAVIGHSRLGKTSLWAGASDPRFALVISNDSGCGGAALSKRRFGETIHAINTRFPHWFCDNFNQYNDKEDKMPFDQHMLIALMAARPVYIASAKDDSWADPKGEFLSGKHASPAYHLYGLKGLEIDNQPPVNQPEKSGHIGYHIRSGRHDITVYDWEQYLDFADKHWK